MTICIQLDFLPEDYRYDFEFIDRFYTSTRYPFIVGMLSGGLPMMDDAEKSLTIANKIYNYVSQILEESAPS